MTHSSRIFATALFAVIAVFLVVYTWLPSRAGLQSEAGRVSDVLAQPNTWYEVGIVTSSGIRLTCRTRRGWPVIGPDRCPLETFENLAGQEVIVLHDGKHFYEVTAHGAMVVDYASHRKAQAASVVLAVLMLGMAVLAWRRR